MRENRGPSTCPCGTATEKLIVYLNIGYSVSLFEFYYGVMTQFTEDYSHLFHFFKFVKKTFMLDLNKCF